MEGPDDSEGFTFVDSTDLQDCIDIDPIQIDDDIPPLPDAENAALSPIAYPEPQQEVVSESDTESELRSSSSDSSGQIPLRMCRSIKSK